MTCAQTFYINNDNIRVSLLSLSHPHTHTLHACVKLLPGFSFFTQSEAAEVCRCVCVCALVYECMDFKIL